MRLHIIGMGLCLALSACGNNNSATSTDTAPGDVSPLSDTEYRALSSTQRYAVANTLLASLYQGTPVLEFFSLTGDLKNPAVKPDAPELERIRTALATPLPPADRTRYLAKANSYTYFTETAVSTGIKYHSTQPLVLPQAVLFEFPLSQDYYHRWMAYVLMNTILFSPALELETVRTPAVSKVYEQLVALLDQGRTMRDIVYEHMVSPPNWERFRSPEDNAREMLEIFLARFIDAEVSPAAAACKNWSSTRDLITGITSIAKGTDANTVPQTVLGGTTVITCEEFYRAVADHPALIPTIATVLVNHFFADDSLQTKRKLIASIVAAQPKTFDALFSLILFSKQYLLYTARPKNAEESFFGLARRVGWRPSKEFFDGFTDVRNPLPPSVTLLRIGQATMYYKLGRASRAPTNTLHFSLHQKLMRESLLLNRLSTPDGNSGWVAAKLLDDPAVVALSGDDFIHYLFLSVTARRAQPEELDTLNKIIAAKGYTKDRIAKATVVFDYLSRLPELYSFSTISNGSPSLTVFGKAGQVTP